jgi:hypothetical protein
MVHIVIDVYAGGRTHCVLSRFQSPDVVFRVMAAVRIFVLPACRAGMVEQSHPQGLFSDTHGDVRRIIGARKAHPIVFDASHFGLAAEGKAGSHPSCESTAYEGLPYKRAGMSGILTVPLQRFCD